jgi:cbb3-type cytochrome oxidase maturation protein
MKLSFRNTGAEESEPVIFHLLILNTTQPTMAIILVLVFLSMLVAGGFLGAFLWAVNSGQYEDTYSPSVRMLFDEKPKGDTQSKK